MSLEFPSCDSLALIPGATLISVVPLVLLVATASPLFFRIVTGLLRRQLPLKHLLELVVSFHLSLLLLFLWIGFLSSLADILVLLNGRFS